MTGDRFTFWGFWSWPFMYDEPFCMKNLMFLASIQFEDELSAVQLSGDWSLMTKYDVFANQSPSVWFRLFPAYI
jgi:hypothetical protein